MTERVLYPVIDLLGGRLVRALRDSDEGPSLADDDPIAVAVRWREQGAQWLHLVDLDGAREGAPRQLETIRAIIQAAELPAQIAGGLRDTASVEAALEAGATRVVLSAATPDDQALVAECVARWGERIAVALEARDGRVTVAGWLPSDAATALGVARAMGYLGAATLLFTSATTSGDADPLPGRLRRVLPDMRLITGGAVASLDDLRRLLALGMNGVLLGRALHDGLFTLEEALAVARETPEAPENASILAAHEDESEDEGEQEQEAETAEIALGDGAIGVDTMDSIGASETREVASLRARDEMIAMVETQEITSVPKPVMADLSDHPAEESPGEDATGDGAEKLE